MIDEGKNQNCRTKVTLSFEQYSNAFLYKLGKVWEKKLRDVSGFLIVTLDPFALESFIADQNHRLFCTERIPSGSQYRWCSPMERYEVVIYSRICSVNLASLPKSGSLDHSKIISSLLIGLEQVAPTVQAPRH